MPAALNFNTLIAATPRAESTLKLHSMDFHETVTLDLTNLHHPEKGHWSAYPAGVAWALMERGIKLHGAEFTISGNVPPGSGLSSSASIEVATATALLALGARHLPHPPPDRPRLPAR